ncbi:Protein ORANGE, chloroplastic [Glycine soja]
MLCLGRFGGVSHYPIKSGWSRRDYTNNRPRWCLMAAQESDSSFAPSLDSDKTATAGFCIIEGPETVQDFAKMELQEIQDNIRSRRNKIFLHMEEVRRLRIQQRIKSAELGILNEEQENELPNFPSFIPFLPPLTSANLKQYYATCFSLIAGIILFGGLLAPSLELKLGLGGTSYADFIESLHLPMQLSQVDPIVASFSGGAVGVISALMVVEINNVKQQEQKRCKYCLGTGKISKPLLLSAFLESNVLMVELKDFVMLLGYLACARCSSTGALVLIEPVSTVKGGDKPLSPPKTERCSNCSGSGKVMCPTCLCTGMAMASEHDPRIDPFD